MSRLFSRSLITSSIRQFHPPKLRFLASVSSKSGLYLSYHRASLSFVGQRPPPAELRDGSQSMPAVSHLGET
ncbi:hypothetical protein F2Q68_00046069 [Brassica cretica]|uniref:Uncharacterized protein n=1 Tax=Brassica cretica TaxID=69181 RepID=A0A8S9LQ26_BRACR|nr:hypothetical protein F2Q68_00046069 [Brassica cretica]